MNHDLALVCAVLEHRDIAEPVRMGVQGRYLGPEAQTYWDALVAHYDAFHEVPSVEYFQSLFPSYEHQPPDDSFEALISELKTRYLHITLDDLLTNVAETNLEDPWQARRDLADALDRLMVDVQREDTDLIAGSNKTDVMRQISYLRSNHGLLGIPWPWEFLNENSKGVCPGNFIYVYGREKSRKTFLLIYLACWFESLGEKVLFLTREMTREEIAWRAYPMRARLPYKELTAGKLSSDGELRLEAVMDDLNLRSNLIISEVDGGMAGVRAKIQEVRPTVVIHDYMQAVAEDEMEGSKRQMKEHEALGNVAGGFKRLAMKLKIPIIGCGHANREGEKLKGKSSTEYAGSDKIVRRVDYGFRVITDEANNRTALILNAGRDARKFLSLTFDSTLCTTFGDFLEPQADWVEALDSAKDEEDARKKKHKASEDAPPPPTGTKLRKILFTRGVVTPGSNEKDP